MKSLTHGMINQSVFMYIFVEDYKIQYHNEDSLKDLISYGTWCMLLKEFLNASVFKSREISIVFLI